VFPGSVKKPLQRVRYPRQGPVRVALWAVGKFSKKASHVTRRCEKGVRNRKGTSRTGAHSDVHCVGGMGGSGCSRKEEKGQHNDAVGKV